MGEHKQIKQVESKIIVLRDTQVILDRDIAELYGVETRDINKAVKNNPDKFPQGYIITLEKEEKKELVENFHRFNPLKHSTVLPKAFTEKGLYMLATIIKSTLSREIKRNSTPSGKYIWTKAHDMAMQRRKNTVTNAKLSDELVWRIKEYITNDQWSPRQISGYLRINEGIEVSHQSIYNIIHNDTTGKPPNT